VIMAVFKGVSTGRLKKGKISRKNRKRNRGTKIRPAGRKKT